MKAIAKVVVMMIILGLPILFWSDIKGALSPKDSEKVADGKDKKKKKKDKEQELPVSTEVEVLERWELPAVLTEISGIGHLDAARFACIQDEQGTIYVYNTAGGRVEKEVPFAGAGDFEGITVAGNTAYVVQSDGRIYEVRNFLEGKPAVQSYTTHLTVDHDVEGLTYDSRGQRLLLAIKGEETGSPDYKGIYAFDLSAKKLSAEPVLKINLADPVFKTVREKKRQNIMQPSELAVHPRTGDIYVLEGVTPKLLVMDAAGRKKKLYVLSSSDFPQAEGLAFTPQGELFISSEGKSSKGTIVKVAIREAQ